jgi:23S rRNA (uracil1939-C5)-methyltransferase
MIKGEEADVRIIAEKKNYSYGIIDRLISASPYRVEPDCKIAYKCGGCDYRHIAYEYQLQLKQDVLNNTFKDFKVNEIIPCDDPYYYRNKVQIPCRDHKMGFYRKFSNDIVEFDDCFLESQDANQIIRDLKTILIGKPYEKMVRHVLIKKAVGTGEIMVAFIVRDMGIDLSDIVSFLTEKYPDIRSIIMNLNDKETNVILGLEEKVIYGSDHICDVFDGIRVNLSLKSFYQVNYGQMLKLYQKIRELSGVSENDRVLDLYCGIGTISLYLCRYAKHVTGVEIVEAAVADAKENAKLNGFDNTDFILADASKNMDAYLKDRDIVIVDPPRKGISQDLIASLKGNRIKRIVYVSCNPATLARDLQLLQDTYDVGEITPVDMFPFTVHTENVVSLTIKE